VFAQALTTVEAGPKADTVTGKLLAATGKLLVRGQDGGDTLDAQGATVGLMLDGGPGDDTLKGVRVTTC